MKIEIQASGESRHELALAIRALAALIEGGNLPCSVQAKLNPSVQASAVVVKEEESSALQKGME